jgi:hypothetical protein
MEAKLQTGPDGGRGVVEARLVSNTTSLLISARGIGASMWGKTVKVLAVVENPDANTELVMAFRAVVMRKTVRGTERYYLYPLEGAQKFLKRLVAELGKPPRLIVHLEEG